VLKVPRVSQRVSEKFFIGIVSDTMVSHWKVDEARVK
jgi:hypothetical protein